MRLAYLVTSYRSPEQLLRLVRTLRRADSDARVLVHHDVFVSDAPVAELAALDVRLLTSEHPIVWGDMSLERVRWRMFAELLDGPPFDWMVLLSEQDYPVAPPAALKSFLAGSGADAVIEAQRIEDIADPGLRRECELRYRHTYAALPGTGLARRLPPRLRSALRRTRLLGYRVINRVQSRMRFYFLPEELHLPTLVGVRRSAAALAGFGPIWYSEAWYALSREAVEHVVEHVRRHPEFVRYASRTVIPLESATATIVANAAHLTVLDAPLHHIRWSKRTSGRPDEFGLDDLDELLGSGRWFARKFSVTDHRVLDQLDERVLGAPAPGAPA